MLDSGTKHPENRIHLYDPVGLINDNYGNYKPSNYTIKPRRQTVSYDNFIDTSINSDNLNLRSYNSVTDSNSTKGLRSFDSFEVDSFNLRSYTEKINSESINGGRTSSDGGLRFVLGENNGVDDDQLDAPTPRLWRPSSVKTPLSLNPSNNNNSPKSVKFSINSLNSNYQTMPVNSRTQAIARGRKELMDMVKDLPETFYELSLKDIVEQKGVEMETRKEADRHEDKKDDNGENDKETKKEKKSSKKVKKSESKKKMVRSRSVDNGKFLLKTSVFPILGSRKSKKSLNGGGSSFKVVPMPKSEHGSNGQGKGGEKEWWRRKSCMSSESDGSNPLSNSSSSSRSSSNSSNGRRSNRFFPTCCIFNGRRVEGKK